jgi:hypothetical protein
MIMMSLMKMMYDDDYASGPPKSANDDDVDEEYPPIMINDTDQSLLSYPMKFDVITYRMWNYWQHRH